MTHPCPGETVMKNIVVRQSSEEAGYPTRPPEFVVLEIEIVFLLSDTSARGKQTRY